MPAPAFRSLAISDRVSLPGGDLARWLACLAAAAPDAVQIREKDLSDRALYELARQARAVLPGSIRLLVNGRLDVALAAGADGVHLPADGPPAAALRARFGIGVLLGVSTHCLAEVERAQADGADYVTFGPVYATASKARYGPPLGTGALRQAASIGIPVLALGGITLERLDELASAGAAGVAGIRLFQPPSDLDAVLAAIRRTFPG
jgi:thiamine-phosphate pyrophosphorylase